MAKYKCLISGYEKWDINKIYNGNNMGRQFTVGQMNEKYPRDWQLVEDDTSEIIGYKLKEEFRGCRSIGEAAAKIEGHICFGSGIADIGNEEIMAISFINNSNPQKSIGRLRKAKVLDLWFEPVYAPKYTLPKINGYEGRIDGKYVVYGNNCAWLDVWALRGILATAETWQKAAIDTKENSHNRSIKSIKLSSDVEITMDEIKQIVEYFDNI